MFSITSCNFGNEALSEKIVYHCFAEFRYGLAFLSKKCCEGRPKSVGIPNNIDGVHKMIEEDRHATHHEIKASHDISHTAIHSILKEHFAVKRICSKWILHNLTEAKKEVHANWCKEMKKKNAD